MKTTLLFLSVFLSASLFGQNVNIPDANFKAYLVNDYLVNTNQDKEIQISEAKSYAGSIYISYSQINSLIGIEEFSELTYLDCSNNQLTSLDVSKNTALTELYCRANQLTCVKGLQDGLKKADVKKCD